MSFSAYGKTCVDVFPSTKIFYDFKPSRNKQAPTFLLIHGLSMDSSTLKFAGRLEAAGFGVLKVDLLGHGKSLDAVETDELRFENQVAAVKELIETLDLKRLRIVGHSYGSAVAMKLAEYPSIQKRVQSLVAITPYIRRVDHYFREQLIASFRPWKKIYYPWLSDKGFDLMVRNYLDYCRLIYGDAYMYAHYREVISKFFPNDPNLEKKVRAAIVVAEDIVRINFVENPPRLGKVPVHIVYAGQDHLIPEFMVLELADVLSATGVKVLATKLANSSHMVPMEEPDLISDLLLGKR